MVSTETATSTGLKTEDLVINMGPQHPSTHGVLRLKLVLHGEVIKQCEPVIGYLHRGMEWLGQNRNFVQYQALVDRVDYLAGMSDSHAYVGAVEQIAGIEVPQRAEYLRILMAELNRICSHQLSLGIFMLDLGAMMGFPFYAFRDRESILSLLEEVSGQRMMFNYIRIGGVQQDLPKGWLAKAEALVKDKLLGYVDEYEDIITNNPIFTSRTKGIGIIEPNSARAFGLTGPNIRASGVDYDIRTAKPYSRYKEFDFKVITREEGDIFARYKCRVEEIRESCKIVLQAIEKIRALPSGEQAAKETELVAKKIMPGFKAPAGETYFAVESPRGELGLHLITDGTAVPYRIKWRSPSFFATNFLPEMAIGQPIADIVAIFSSLDVILPDVDR
ncbi:MAG: NADH-quinone oxidoreductase subunit D [Proteobacteria bacterium]|nr:NADH-quinone oxidoreductase subunit D [Pseudomonadota bacterium]